MIPKHAEQRDTEVNRRRIDRCRAAAASIPAFRHQDPPGPMRQAQTRRAASNPSVIATTSARAIRLRRRVQPGLRAPAGAPRRGRAADWPRSRRRSAEPAPESPSPPTAPCRCLRRCPASAAGAGPEASVLKHGAIHSWIRRPRIQPDRQHAGHIGVRLLQGDAGLEPRDALIVEEAQNGVFRSSRRGRISSGSP